jgi:uncharacterized phiE125 gp8 family phage protein
MLLTQKYGLTAVTTDLAEPLEIDDVRQYTRVNDPDDSVWIRMAIRAARELVEVHTHRQIMTKTWDLTLESFPAATASIPLPRPPLQSIDSITYVPSTGGTTTIDSTSLHVDIASEPGRVAPVFNSYWPTARQQMAAVTIRYTAGYGDTPNMVPERLKQAMLMLVGHWYENRETIVIGMLPSQVELAFEALCGSERFGSIH